MTLTEQQFELIKDKYRDAAMVALFETIASTAYKLGCDKAEVPGGDVAKPLLDAVDDLCLASLKRMGVTAIGDELFWKED